MVSHFFIIFKRILYFIHFLYNLLSHIVTLFHSFFIAALYKCDSVDDCPQLYEFTTIDYKCILGTCVPLGVIRKKGVHNNRAEKNAFLP
uniref:Nodule-specific cysteine-rich peptide L13 n=1 Tax=Lens culinaris TaxID=3864 RepID=A0A7T8DVN0_LENCU|nr:nodule-specific cysteine-rich peptide L13 [Lens culinaris]